LKREREEHEKPIDKVQLIFKELDSFNSEEDRMYKIMQEPWWTYWKEFDVSDFSEWSRSRMTAKERDAFVNMCTDRKRLGVN